MTVAEIKTPERIAAEIVNDNTAPDEWSPVLMSTVAGLVAAGIEADRAQLIGPLAAARHAIDLSRDAAEGDSNDAEIEILHDVRDRYQQIVEAVAGEWEHEPNADHLACEEWPHERTRLPLDPLPWDGNTATPENPDDNRHAYDVGAELVENGFALGFAPRPGYSQNQEDYQ